MNHYNWRRSAPCLYIQWSYMCTCIFVYSCNACFCVFGSRRALGPRIQDCQSDALIFTGPICLLRQISDLLAYGWEFIHKVAFHGVPLFVCEWYCTKLTTVIECIINVSFTCGTVPTVRIPSYPRLHCLSYSHLSVYYTRSRLVTRSHSQTDWDQSTLEIVGMWHTGGHRKMQACTTEEHIFVRAKSVWFKWTKLTFSSLGIETVTADRNRFQHLNLRLSIILEVKNSVYLRLTGIV